MSHDLKIQDLFNSFLYISIYFNSFQFISIYFYHKIFNSIQFEGPLCSLQAATPGTPGAATPSAGAG